MSHPLRLRDVTFGYGRGSQVLRDLSLELGPGLTLLAGLNGSGKSTLLKLLAGVEKPDRGTVEVAGLDVWRQEVAARAAIAYLPEEPDVTPYATLLEVLRLVCALRGEPLEAGHEALARAGLESCGGRSIRELSKGQRRRALLAAAWVGAPTVLLLDEPLDGMDRSMRARILAWIDERRRAGGTAVVATHSYEPFASRADRCIGMHEGRPALISDSSGDTVAALDDWLRSLPGQTGPAASA